MDAALTHNSDALLKTDPYTDQWYVLLVASYQTFCISKEQILTELISN